MGLVDYGSLHTSALRRGLAETAGYDDDRLYQDDEQHDARDDETDRPLGETLPADIDDL